MTTQILCGLFLGAAVSGVFPLVNAELLVVATAATLPASAVPTVAVVTALGQMITKTGLYGFARWLPSRLPAKARAALQRISVTLAARPRAAGSLVFCSAAVGLPPFYGTSLTCGALRVRLATFVISGMLGRIARFAILAVGAQRVGAQIAEIALTLVSGAQGVVS